MTRQQLIILAAGGSLAMLLGAWAFQHIGGLAPCKMCIWQRWPHGIAALIGPVALVAGGALAVLLPLAGMAAALTTAGIGVFHAGVERGFWEGPASCSAGSIEGLSTSQLMDQIMAAPLVRCDEIAWQFLGLSMASWNALISLGFATIWLAAALKSRA